jgi:hypothetical protein
MSVMLSKAVEDVTAHRPQYWFAILIWMAVIAASVVAVTAAVAYVAI